MKSHLSNFVSENTIVTLLSIKERKRRWERGLRTLTPTLHNSLPTKRKQNDISNIY